jgi:uncharacterized protein (TIGR03083 family)
VLTAELYPENRARLLELAQRLSDAEAGTSVPALPGWTVKDAYAHLTGLCVDVVDGRMDGAGTAPWTARQVRERAIRSLGEVCAEWVARGPDLDTWLANRDDQATAFVGYDVWNHHQDIRSAVGLTGERDANQLSYLAASALAAFDRRFRDAGAPPLHVVTDTGEWDLGDGARSCASCSAGEASSRSEALTGTEAPRRTSTTSTCSSCQPPISSTNASGDHRIVAS